MNQVVWLHLFQITVKYKYAFKVPKEYKYSLELDKITGNHKWQDANILEHKKLAQYSVLPNLLCFVTFCYNCNIICYDSFSALLTSSLRTISYWSLSWDHYGCTYLNNKVDLHLVKQNRSTSIFLNSFWTFFELFWTFWLTWLKTISKTPSYRVNAYLLLLFELFISSVEGSAETRLIVS